jgi:flavodoxin
MKTVLYLIVFAIALNGTVQAQSKEKTQTQTQTQSQSQTKKSDNKSKILIVYFSWGGNTRLMAKQIQQQTGGDLFEITTVKPYPKNYDECVTLAKKEQQEKIRPSLSSELKNLADYDMIFIGYPNWWGTMPMALFTFLEKYDLSSKTVIPFCTHGGGRWQRSLDDLKKLCPRSKISEGLTISGDMVRRSTNDITKWLQKIGITNKK